jgi:glyoxylase-like metal-dependent hydrolase (beta-lactamase superfamily II)
VRTEVAPGVHRLGNRLVNFFLIEDGGKLTLVDAGLPRMRGQLEQAVGALGRTMADVEAVLLTHAHADHVGFAGTLAGRAHPTSGTGGVPVHVHEADAAMARTGRPQERERSFLPYLRNRAVWRLLATGVRGGLPQKVPAPLTFADGEVLDVPGRPRVVHAPGHSHGCVAFHLPERGVLLCGDVLCSYNPLTGRLGPQIMAGGFNVSSAQALASLDRIEPLDAGVLAFGHGEPWREGAAAAVARAREAGPS